MGIVVDEEKDILCGRGKGKYPGNKRLDKLVRDSFEEYEASNTETKGFIALRLIGVAKDWSGRFLKCDQTSNEWCEITIEEAVAKVKRDFANMKSRKKRKTGAANKENSSVIVDRISILEDALSDEQTESALLSVLQVSRHVDAGLSPEQKLLQVMHSPTLISAVATLIARSQAEQQTRSDQVPIACQKGDGLSTAKSGLGTEPDECMSSLQSVRDMIVKSDRQYTGTVLDGKPHGMGTMTYLDGRVACGEWNNGFMNGKGFIHFEPGESYYGKLCVHKMQGVGVRLHKNGSRHVGNFSNNKLNGRGELITADKHEYDGDFVEGKLEGMGFHTFPNGQREQGMFKGGVLKPSIENGGASLSSNVHSYDNDPYFLQLFDDGISDDSFRRDLAGLEV